MEETMPVASEYGRQYLSFWPSGWATVGLRRVCSASKPETRRTCSPPGCRAWTWSSLPGRRESISSPSRPGRPFDTRSCRSARSHRRRTDARWRWPPVRRCSPAGWAVRVEWWRPRGSWRCWPAWRSRWRARIHKFRNPLSSTTSEWNCRLVSQFDL